MERELKNVQNHRPSFQHLCSTNSPKAKNIPFVITFIINLKLDRLYSAKWHFVAK